MQHKSFSHLTGVILTFEDVSALQLFHRWSLTQSPAEKHQNHVLDHFHAISKSVCDSLISVSVGIPRPAHVTGEPCVPSRV